MDICLTSQDICISRQPPPSSLSAMHTNGNKGVLEHVTLRQGEVDKYVKPKPLRDDVNRIVYLLWNQSKDWPIQKKTIKKHIEKWSDGVEILPVCGEGVKQGGSWRCTLLTAEDRVWKKQKLVLPWLRCRLNSTKYQTTWLSERLSEFGHCLWIWLKYFNVGWKLNPVCCLNDSVWYAVFELEKTGMSIFFFSCGLKLNGRIWVRFLEWYSAVPLPLCMYCLIVFILRQVFIFSNAFHRTIANIVLVCFHILVKPFVRFLFWLSNAHFLFSESWIHYYWTVWCSFPDDCTYLNVVRWI